ncbi:MAG TPA: tRNA preQ1(34) S-adenosylmethionine ribosyltransferase-isomerase QueA, partial [Rhodobacteraceae bacterium]|nr:tRNA preQ1(34) S-adenosylmethionine ribosyltransferase-isomerase QueA [Paracoccaceae bacterium]
EVTLLEPSSDGSWNALVKPLKKIRDGETIDFNSGLRAKLVSRRGGIANLAFNLEGEDFDQALQQAGAMPLPPYIAAKRPADARDFEDYQSIWACRLGAVAAPTASLHFDAELIERLRKAGIGFSYVTLHVGAGTFLPVKVENLSDHRMHSERGEITAAAAHEINETRRAGGRIIPVGTTSLRLIESAADKSGQLSQWSGATDIFIMPGYRFRIADALITNFHLPRSTLLMLVSALMGRKRIRDIYDYAIAREYRFFSYGDASLLLPDGETRRH